MTTICVFGDSVTYGAWDRESGGWVSRLRKYLDSQNGYHIVYNVGISGDTTQSLLKRFKSESAARFSEAQSEKDPSIIIFDIGANDAGRFEGKRTIENKEFSENLRKLKVMARKYTKQIFFLNLIPVSEQKTDPVEWNHDISYLNNDINALNDVLKSVSFEEAVNIINVRDSFDGRNYHKLLEDGLHPNAEGHELIFIAVKDALIKAKIIS